MCMLIDRLLNSYCCSTTEGQCLIHFFENTTSVKVTLKSIWTVIIFDPSFTYLFVYIFVFVSSFWNVLFFFFFLSSSFFKTGKKKQNIISYFGIGPGNHKLCVINPRKCEVFGRAETRNTQKPG